MEKAVHEAIEVHRRQGGYARTAANVVAELQSMETKKELDLQMGARAGIKIVGFRWGHGSCELEQGNACVVLEEEVDRLQAKT